MTYTQAEPAKDERVIWNDLELKTLATAFAEVRKADCFASPMEVLRKAQAAALPSHRHRALTSLDNAPTLKQRIEEHWLDEMTKTNSEPTIVHVETQQPPDYVDMLQRLDTPSLVAMLFTRLGNEWQIVRPALAALSGKPEANGTGAPLVPPVSLLRAASAKPRKTRVLIIGPLKEQFHEIVERAKEFPVDLQYLDKDKHNGTVPISTDFVILTRHIGHSFEERLRQGLPHGKFFYLEGGITSIVNKLRDISTLLPPRA